MTNLRVGVIGCGSIARHRHLMEYNNHTKVTIVAVCDRNLERATNIAEPYQARAFTDYNELLQDERIDAVSVCLPNFLHAKVSIAALNAGKHVLCEKPMATSSEEAEQMIQAADRNHKVLMIGHNQRFVASHEQAKSMLEAGELGKVYSFRTTFGHGGPEGWSIDGKGSWFFQKEKAFIGAMGDLGVHKADLMRYLLGEEFTQVSAFIETNAKEHTDVDDNAVLILKSASGVIGTLAASWAYNAKEDNSTVIYCEKGSLHLEEDPVYGLVVNQANGETKRYELEQIQSNESGGQTNTHVIDHFVDCILENKQPRTNGLEGKKSLEVILAALEANRTNQIIDIVR